MPNVVFVMTDEQNLRGVSCYKGTLCQTPSVDRLAAEGVLFERAYCSYPVCMPSRAAFMTGRYPHVNGVRANGLTLPDREASLPAILKAARYTTALCGKDHCFSHQARSRVFDYSLTAMHFGLLDPIPEGFPAQAKEANSYYREMRSRLYSPFGNEVIPYPPEVCDAGLITEAAIRFVERVGKSPFFLWLSYPGPHWPFTCPEAYAGLFPPDRVDLPPPDDLSQKPRVQEVARRLLGLDKATEADFRKIISLYYGNCRYIDDQIGRFLARLRALALEEETLVVFTSDHGDYLGEHGLFHKSPSAYDAITRVPFIWRWPGHIRAGERRPELVEGVDLLPTVLDLCGVPVPPGVQGISHAEALLGSAPYRAREECFCECGVEGRATTLEDLAAMPLPEGPYSEWALGASGGADYWNGRLKMVRTDRWKLVYYRRGEGELYDMDADPWELRNLYDSPDHQDIVADLKERLLRWTIESEETLPPLRGSSRQAPGG
ncbi:MAG: sulfatase-like hydrolase/transferase [Armatimonadetes bacterium]|nr:sulfatase-like hydrolase/transferase [Armatimonadota bacterium]